MEDVKDVKVEPLPQSDFLKPLRMSFTQASDSSDIKFCANQQIKKMNTVLLIFIRTGNKDFGT